MYLSNQGVRIHYLDEGKGPAVLLTHAYGASSSMWQPQLEQLSEHYRLIAWDMRGHAGSDSPPSPKAYSEQACVSDMGALLDHLQLQQVILCGLSLGGYLSLAFHLAHPQRVRALSLVSCGPGYRNDEARNKWNRFATRIGNRVQELGLDALGDGSEIRVDEHRSVEGLAMAARGMLAQFDDRIINSLGDIHVPTQVLVGSEDKPYHGSSDYMAGKIPGACKAVIADAGHASNLQQPDEFNRQLSDFISSLPAQSTA